MKMSESECHLIYPSKTKALNFYNISKSFPRKTTYSLWYMRIECWLKNFIAKNSNGWKHIHFTNLRLVYYNLGHYNYSCGSNHVFIKCPAVRLLSTPVWYKRCCKVCSVNKHFVYILNWYICKIWYISWISNTFVVCYDCKWI
jgi:hypothetical protein